MNAIIYSRFSTDRQSESSITDQIRVCREYAAAHSLTVAGTHSDEGISGAALGNRPGVQAAMAAAKSGDVLLVTDLSRLSRSQDLAPLLTRLRHRGVRVLGTQDGYDSDSRTARMQAGLSGIMSEEFRAMIADRTHSALESRAKDQRATGGRAYGYHDGKVDKGEAFIVREIFGRSADGESNRTIAADLNGRRIPSPGSTWKRVTRRADGWMGSGIRVILRNPRYVGRIIWNQSEWKKDPDTGKRTRVMRPKSEWITHTDESQRIVSDELFARAQARMGGKNYTVNQGGTPKYLLSGLLRCSTCGANYVGVNGTEYGCSSHRDGGPCDNAIRVKRTHAENVLLGKLRSDLLSPESIRVIAQDMQAAYAERTKAMQTREAEQPKELLELTARIERLRARLKAGDPDMTDDELQVAIDRAEGKRRELADLQPEVKRSARVLAMLPKAADLARREIAEALAGNSRAALKARVFLKDVCGGEVRLVPEAGGGLVAHWNLNAGALLRAVGTNGSGGRISPVPIVSLPVRLK